MNVDAQLSAAVREKVPVADRDLPRSCCSCFSRTIEGSVDERNAVRVGEEVFVLRKNEDSLDQAPERGESTGEDREHELQDRLVRIPEVEVVSAEAPEKDSEESGSDSGFGLVAGWSG